MFDLSDSALHGTTEFEVEKNFPANPTSAKDKENRVSSSLIPLCQHWCQFLPSGRMRFQKKWGQIVGDVKDLQGFLLDNFFPMSTSAKESPRQTELF